MPTKRWMLLLALLLLFPSVYAAVQEEVYSGTLYSGDSFNVSGEAYSVYYTDIDGDRTDNRITIHLPSGTSLILQQGLCRNIGDYREACFDGIEFWYRNYTLYKNFYYVALRINENLALLELERSIDKKTFLQEETAVIHSVIKNAGGRPATEIAFEDPFPKELAVIQADGCFVNDEGIFWSGSIGKNEEKECTYTLKAMNSTKFSSRAALTYFNGLEYAELESDGETITVPEARLGVNITLGSEMLELNEETNIRIVLENRENKNLYVSWFSVEIPSGLKVLERTKRLRSEDALYRWSGTLEPLEKLEFLFRVKGIRNGRASLPIRADYILNSIHRQILQNPSLTIGEPEPEAPLPTESAAAEEETATEEQAPLPENRETEAVQDTAQQPPEIEQGSPTEHQEEGVSVIKEKLSFRRWVTSPVFLAIDALLAVIILLIVLKIVRVHKEKNRVE